MRWPGSLFDRFDLRFWVVAAVGDVGVGPGGVFVTVFTMGRWWEESQVPGPGFSSRPDTGFHTPVAGRALFVFDCPSFGRTPGRAGVSFSLFGGVASFAPAPSLSPSPLVALAVVAGSGLSSVLGGGPSKSVFATGAGLEFPSLVVDFVVASAA